MSEEAELRRLVHAMWLYIGRPTERQLTTAQKELLYDSVEWVDRENGDYDGPMERWWRE